MIERSSSLAGQFTVVGTSTTLVFNNTQLSGIHSYLYRVRAINNYGGTSPPSNMALGTSITFTDAILYAGQTEIKKEHVYDLRNAINSVRALVPNMSAGTWGDREDLYQKIVLAADVQQLRDLLDAALGQLGITVTAYDDPTLYTGASGTPIRKKHIEQLRERSTMGSSSSSGSLDWTTDSFYEARLDPGNRTGNGDDPLSRNANWSIPLVSLPGRAGLNLGLSLSYNSLVWTKNGNYISFDDDYGFPSPGFRLGFPVIQAPFHNSQANKTSYLLITSSGARVELRQSVRSPRIEDLNALLALLQTGQQPRNPRIGVTTTANRRTPYVDQNVLNDCTKELFGVELRSFTPSRRGSNGTFTGFGPDQLTRSSNGLGPQMYGNDTTITVVNEVSAYTSAQLIGFYNQGKPPNQQLPANSKDSYVCNQRLQETSEITFRAGQAASGTLPDGTRFSVQNYQSSDGVDVSVRIDRSPSHAMAKKNLLNFIRKARVLERGPKKDQSGSVVGQRLVVRFPAKGEFSSQFGVMWVNKAEVYYLQSASLRHVAEFEKKFHL